MLAIGKFNTLFDSKNDKDWFEKVEVFANEMGFDLCLFALLPSRNTPIENAIIFSNYPNAWRTKYDAENYGVLDPTVKHCLKSNMRMIWDKHSFDEPELIDFYDEASSYGLRSGIILPIHGSNSEFGMINFSSSYLGIQEFIIHEIKHSSNLSLLRDYAFESYKHLSFTNSRDASVKLTPRELEVLKWSMVGKSYWDISKIIKCSESTINFHAGNIRKKFNVGSKQQAVVKAITLGLLIPE